MLPSSDRGALKNNTTFQTQNSTAESPAGWSCENRFSRKFLIMQIKHKCNVILFNVVTKVQEKNKILFTFKNVISINHPVGCHTPQWAPSLCARLFHWGRFNHSPSQIWIFINLSRGEGWGMTLIHKRRSEGCRDPLCFAHIEKPKVPKTCDGPILSLRVLYWVYRLIYFITDLILLKRGI